MWANFLRKENFLISLLDVNRKENFFSLINKHLRKKKFLTSLCIDGPIHHQYQPYGPEYYPEPAYPIYPDEEYFPALIHVKLFRKKRIFFLYSFFFFCIGSTTFIIDFTWW